MRWPWVQRKRGNRKLICSGYGRKFSDAHDYNEREVRDLPWGEFRTTVVIEVYRVCCPQCGVKVEKVPQLPSKAPFSRRFEEAVGLAKGCPIFEVEGGVEVRPVMKMNMRWSLATICSGVKRGAWSPR